MLAVVALFPHVWLIDHEGLHAIFLYAVPAEDMEDQRPRSSILIFPEFTVSNRGASVSGVDKLNKGNGTYVF